MSSHDWDPEKARENLAKHGVSFEEAASSLRSPLARVEPDQQHSFTDMRLRITAWSEQGRLLIVVVSISRPGPRIISARRATKRERHAYEARP